MFTDGLNRFRSGLVGIVKAVGYSLDRWDRHDRSNARHEPLLDQNEKWLATPEIHIGTDHWQSNKVRSCFRVSFLYKLIRLSLTASRPTDAAAAALLTTNDRTRIQLPPPPDKRTSQTETKRNAETSTRNNADRPAPSAQTKPGSTTELSRTAVDPPAGKSRQPGGACRGIRSGEYGRGRQASITIEANNTATKQSQKASTAPPTTASPRTTRNSILPRGSWFISVSLPFTSPFPPLLPFF
jgi:hypothetical protein